MYWPHSFNSSVYQGVWRGHPCGWVTLAPTFGWRRTFSSSTIYLGFMPVVVWGVIRNWNRKNQSMQSKIPGSPSVVTGPIMWPIYWPAKPRWSLDHEWLDHSHGWIGGGACIWFLWNWEPIFTFSSKELCIPGHHTNDLATFFLFKKCLDELHAALRSSVFILGWNNDSGTPHDASILNTELLLMLGTRFAPSCSAVPFPVYYGVMRKPKQKHFMI